MSYIRPHTFIRRAFSSVNHQTSLRYLLILDFKTTSQTNTDSKPQEIFEFPTVVYDLHLKTTTATFHEYVKPIHNPLLTDYCIEMTGIKQSMMDQAATFPGVWTLYNQFLASQKFIEEPESFTFLTNGNWVLKAMLPSQLELSAQDHPMLSTDVPAHFKRWINIKRAYGDLYSSKKPGSLEKISKKLGLRVSRKARSGIDDCRSLAKIVAKMREDGWEPKITSEVDE